jgi:hypothetical protein
MRGLLAAAAAAVAVLGVTGCGTAQAPPGEGAGTFMTRILREELTGEWSVQWNELHPGHQHLISRAQYVACSQELATNIGTGHETYRVLGVRDERIHVSGIPQHDSKVVTISFHTPGNRTTPTYRMHAVAVAGRWTWILGGRFLSEVQRGRCLDGSPLPTATRVKS